MPSSTSPTNIINNNNDTPPTTKYGLDQVNVSFLNDVYNTTATEATSSSKTLPLLISPRWNTSAHFLRTFLEVNRPWVNDQIIKYGAVLVRGFDVNDAVDFEQATLALQPDLCDAYRGTSPRSLMPNTKYAFSAADVPVTYPIAQHLEMSFLKSPPRQLYFGCVKASTKAGGETSLCDFRKVYQELSPELRHKLQTKKIKYSRRHYRIGESHTYDVGAMLGWPQLFGATTKEEVEAVCKEEQAPPIKWVGPNQDTFLQEWIDEPFQLHPDTNESVWFNHSQVFHWTTFPCELWFAFCRIHDWHLLMHFILISIYSVIKYGLLGYTMALNTTFGDGEPISFREMNEIRAAIHKNMVYSRWRKGDILCIDNFSTSHGRQPTYDKGRKVIVAWSHPHDKRQSPSSSNNVSETTTTNADAIIPILRNKVGVDGIPTTNVTKNGDHVDQSMPDLMSLSPDSSPESTLNSSEAQTLQEAFQEQFLANALSHVLSKNIYSGQFRNKQSRHRSLNSCPNLLHAGSDFWSNDDNETTKKIN